MNLNEYIRVIENYRPNEPYYVDLSPLTTNRDCLREAVDRTIEDMWEVPFDYIVSPVDKGYLLPSAVSYALGVGFVPFPKVQETATDHEIMPAENGFVVGALPEIGIKGKRMVVMADILGAGKTVKRTADLLVSKGAEILYCQFLLELPHLGGRQRLEGFPVSSRIQYSR